MENERSRGRVETTKGNIPISASHGICINADIVAVLGEDTANAIHRSLRGITCPVGGLYWWDLVRVATQFGL